MSKITDTIIFLSKHNSWRRGDETFEMQDPKDIGCAIDDAIHLLRKYDELEKENEQLKGLLSDISGWMLDNDYDCGQNGSRLYDHITNILEQNERTKTDE